MALLFLDYINKRLNIILEKYIDAEVDRISAVIVGDALNKINQSEEYDFIISNDNNEMTYNTKDINDFRNKLVDIITLEFNQLETGTLKDGVLPQQEKLRKKYPFFSNGYLCEVTLNSIRNSTVLGNIGPVIPIKLTFMGYVDSSIESEVREYGINNALVEVNVNIKISNMISMPISTRIHHSTIKNTVSLELIKGEIPNYYFK